MESGISSAGGVAVPPIASLLVVDDSRVQRNHMVATCRALGVELIHEAASGAEALVLLASLQPLPQLLIVDLEMPGMDGIELIEHLGRGPLRVPLIVASTRETILIESVQTMARNLGLPVLAAMRKPLTPGALQAAFDQIGQLDAASASVAIPDATSKVSAAALARAIVGGEIAVHYQPKVDIRTGIVRGVEVLARWNLVGMGAVRPDHFIALAEREGLILALTRSVMAQAMEQAALWNTMGLKLSIAINLSPLVLDQPTLVDEICALARRHHLGADQVVLEITESSLVDCMGAALGVLNRLRLHGFGLSIDDYGTGFSSMQQLSRIPFTELKIDRSFVHGACERNHLRVILQSALDMAHQLDLSTVAEGVETLADWQLLQECGCDLGQGYLIARPMPAKEMPRWIRQQPARLWTLRSAALPGLGLQT